MRQVGRLCNSSFANSPNDLMRAIDIMTSEVITVDANATVAALANLLVEHGISGVPVVDKANRVIGMVTEGDLLHRAETGTERRSVLRLEMTASTNTLAENYIKSHGSKVKDVMTRKVISVTETTPGRQYCGSVGGQQHQACSGVARWQARRCSKPRANLVRAARHDNRRASERC
jgi:CBS-domain-containing membrane protein